MILRWRGLASLFFILIVSTRARGAGSGFNVAVIINQNSTNSMQLGNYYCEQRHIPPQNVVRINWSGSSVEWSRTNYESVLLNPFLATLQSRGLTNQIEYVVLSMDIPYRVVDANSSTFGVNSSTSPLFYGFKTDGVPGGNSCTLPSASANSYAGKEEPYSTLKPATATTNSFLASMITSSNLAQAKLLVDRGVSSDSTFPTQPVYLGKSDDIFRNVRFYIFDNTVFDSQVIGDGSVLRTNVNQPTGLGMMRGYMNGVQLFTVDTNSFIPGAMADSLTSFGGKLFEPNDQTSLLAYLQGGASASYGTVVEPCNYLEKFPSSQNYFYQARGFSIAECYYLGVTNPYQGLLVTEPLAAPFARHATGSWSGLPAGAVLAGTTNLTAQFTANDSQHPIQQVDLFIDGALVQTVTNVAPRQNNALTVSLNGHPLTYTVPASATIKSVTTGITTLLNANSNTTKVAAYSHGDRIELRSLDITRSAALSSLATSNSIGTASAQTAWVNSPQTNLLATTAYGLRSYFITNAPQNGDYLQLTAIKTNGTTVSVFATNVSNTTLSGLAKTLFNAVNASVNLSGPDGLIVEDINMHEDIPFIYGNNDHSGEFNIRARSPGWAQSQIQVRLTGSPTFSITPSTTNRIDENVPDLQHRDHLYIIAGTTNLAASFGFNTSTQMNGFHELTAVAYEGSHVRTQSRAAQQVQILNNPLSAVFTPLLAGTNWAVDGAVQFSVVANSGSIARIDLFSTGGLLGSVSNQSSASFSVAGTNLGVGLHPFYSIVTANTGIQYRTETRWIRLVGADSPFTVSVSSPPVVLSWPSTSGRTYEILASTNLSLSFQVSDSVTATNTTAFWSDTNAPVIQRFYRVRTAN